MNDTIDGIIGFVWVASVVTASIVGAKKRRFISAFFLGVFLGPVGAVIAWKLTKRDEDDDTPPNAIIVYGLILILPFIAPFFRAQPFIGIKHIFGTIFFIAIACVVPFVLIAWPFYIFQEMHKTWNYRVHDICVQDHLDI
jgi:hypothetical protein